MKLEERLIALRKQKRLTQQQLAEKLQVSRQVVSKWETGSHLPSIEKVAALARLYDVSMDAILKDSDANTASEQATPELESEEIWKENRALKLLLCFSVSAILVLLLGFGMLWHQERKANHIGSQDEMMVDTSVEFDVYPDLIDLQS